MDYKLKIDLHIHSREDVAEQVFGHDDLLPATEIIDLAIAANYDAISFTHHGLLYNDHYVSDYAKERGLLLISGLEAIIERKHVLLINFTKHKHILNFTELAKNISEDVAVIAPHPFYGGSSSLHGTLIEHIDLFDAIEYCHYYYRFLNPNRKAIKVAQQHHLPLVGNSDMHNRFQFGSAFSLVDTKEKSIPAIIDAIKNGRVTAVSNVMTLRRFVTETLWIANRTQKELRFKLVWHLNRFLERS